MTSPQSPSTSSRDSPFYANQVAARLFEVGNAVPFDPKLGRIVPELHDPNVRERFVYSYRVIYELRNEAIEILAVIHGKRLLESDERFSP
jgi:plasmid stabilization system protein ParE